jgi:hypothetical protein
MATRTTTIRLTTTTYDACGDGSSSPKLFSPREFTLEDLFDAYFDCRKHKRNSLNQLVFEADLETNLISLWRDLHEGRYKIGRSIAFVIRHPKIREVWAADFRDRIVHHLVYNAISDHFYRRFIRDSYACIPGRGIHDGLHRVSRFARSVTRNWSHPAYALKIDVANFFNSIDHDRLLKILEKSIAPGWRLDLIRQIIHHDPRSKAVFKSSAALFSQVPPHKSLLLAPGGKGLPIGNLTSQFFANLYMNELDQYAKHALKVRYYGRYVDDMVLLDDDPDILNYWRLRIDTFLQEELGLHLHPNKIWLNRADAGIDFMGFVIKPERNYLRRSSLNRCRQKIRAWELKGSPVDEDSLVTLTDTVTSYLGMLQNVNGYNARKSLCHHAGNLFINISPDYKRVHPAGCSGVEGKRKAA